MPLVDAVMGEVGKFEPTQEQNGNRVAAERRSANPGLVQVRSGQEGMGLYTGSSPRCRLSATLMAAQWIGWC